MLRNRNKNYYVEEDVVEASMLELSYGVVVE